MDANKIRDALERMEKGGGYTAEEILEIKDLAEFAIYVVLAIKNGFRDGEFKTMARRSMLMNDVVSCARAYKLIGENDR